MRNERNKMKKLLLLLVFLALTISAGAQTPYEVFGHKGKVLKTDFEKGGGIIELINTDSNSAIYALKFDFINMKFYAYDWNYQELSHGEILPTVNKKWWSRDPLESKYPGESPYSFVGNNPIIFIDPFGLEKITVIGGPDEKGSDRNKFYNVGLKQVQDYLYETRKTNEKVSVILFNTNNDDYEDFKNEIKNISNGRNIDILRIEEASQLTNYMNTKSQLPISDNSNRLNDKITAMSFIGHGFPSSFRPDYGINGDGSINDWDITQANELNSKAFNYPTIYFYSCRPALAEDEEYSNPNNLARIVSEKTKGSVFAWKSKSNFAGIYAYGYNFNATQRFTHLLSTYLFGGTYSLRASDYYPIGSEDPSTGKPALKVHYFNGVLIQ
jgi:hypothetical protein